MSEPKTRPTAQPPEDFIAALPDAQRAADCRVLLQMMQAASGHPAVMWGSAIVGFGARAQRYADGRVLDWPEIAFSPRKGDISVYLMDGTAAHAASLARLGRHKTGQVCLYLRRLADVDAAVLQQILQDSLATQRGRAD